MLACMEVEGAWRSALGFHFQLDDRPTTNDYVRLLPAMRLNEWAVTLSAHPSYGVVRPFENWSAASPTKSLVWYQAYNATKHDRLASLTSATLGNLVAALAAVFVMRVARFGMGAVAEDTEFHADEFSIRTAPVFELAEEYIRPLNVDDDPDWLPTWHPTVFPFIP